MKKVFSIQAASILVFLLSGAAFGADVDLKASQFQWKATKKVGSFHEGEIFLKSAKAEIKGDKIVSGEFVMDMNSFVNKDLQGEWNQKFITHVKSPDFFDVQKFPTATLVIAAQPSATSVSGQLTIKDKTEPVTVNFAKDGSAYKGVLKIDRTKFGITYGSENFFKNLVADKIINNEFEVSFKVVMAGNAKKAKK